MPDKTMPRLIYLLRHGKIMTKSHERQYIGHIDIPLSAEGRQQAGLLQAEFSGQEISAVFCSDLIRSVDTAKIIAEKLMVTPIIKPELREISMGDWEGKTFREIEQLYPLEYINRGSNITSYRIPGGESFCECQSRILNAFTEIADTTQGNIVIVGHAGINRILLCHILGMPLENLFHLEQDYGCINILIYKNGQYRIKLLNAQTDARGVVK